MEILKKKRKLTIITPLYRVFFLETNKSVNIYKNYLATIPVSDH